MDINELESFNLSDAVKFHDKLNPRLFKNDKLLSAVKKQLMLIAEDFLTFMGISNLDVADIRISGSNAAYSYTPHSDLDLHILIDFSKLPDDEIYKELFGAKKTLYNDRHDITVEGIPVELYVQDTAEKHTSLGEYSVLNDRWVKIPKKKRANLDEKASRAKYEKLGELVELALQSQDEEQVSRVLDIIKRYRMAGLDRAGEFGPENLAYKVIRKYGYIQDLYDLKAELHSQKISTESLAERSQIELEDYDPNGPPPGPEFKPTMPVGTVRVDVSDVYDWYKLGQHISNLKGLGKHDFGKGPPSTILSFGDEDLEHQYIQALKKTGLDVTDIDPPGGPKVKGMKTDPTYNVNEEQEELGSEKVIDTARRMYDRYKDLTYTARERAHGHAMNYESNTPEYRYWIAVADQIQRLEDSNLDVKEDQTLQFAAEKTAAVNPYGGWRDTQFRGAIGESNSKSNATQKQSQRFWHESTMKFRNLQEEIDHTMNLKIDWREKIELLEALGSHKTINDELDKKVVEQVKTLVDNFTSKNLKLNKKYIPVPITILHEKVLFHDVENNYPAKTDADFWVLTDFDKKQATLQLGKKELTYPFIESKTNVLFALILVDSISKYQMLRTYINLTFDASLPDVGINESASGYIPSKKEANDPRFKTALTVDIKPDTMQKNAKKLGWKLSRAGIPPLLRK
jgi:hypothetical protein